MPRDQGCEEVVCCGEAADCAYTLAAHDLRTPLSVILAGSEMLRDNPNMAADDRERLLDAMIAEGGRLQGSIEGLLAEWPLDRPTRPIPRDSKCDDRSA